MGKQYVYTTEFSDERRLEHGFYNRKHVFLVKITFSALLSLLQLIMRFKAAYSAKSQTNFDQTTRISAKVRYKQVSSMKLSYFLEIILQQSYMHV